jgi:hypothetical protein
MRLYQCRNHSDPRPTNIFAHILKYNHFTPHVSSNRRALLIRRVCTGSTRERSPVPARGGAER